MGQVFIRVDNRLVHGQILEAWVPYLQANRIIVVNRDVASDPFRESVIRMAVPIHMGFDVYDIDDFVRHAGSPDTNSGNTIVLFDNIGDVLEAFRNGFRFTKLNIGNVYDEDGKIRCSSTIILNENDLNGILHLVDAGVEVELRCVPRDKPVDFVEMMERSMFRIVK
ncbi:MAG TPA: PTS sugar transporter subunit IIB [Syntrophales bacterium]|nr:PTS sugar transporter subunit IIB [Syntrophales bacterium]